MTDFAKRYLSFEFDLRSGVYAGHNSGTVRVDGLRASLTISRAGSRSLSTAQIRCYGLSLSLMNQLSTLGKYINEANQNKVTVFAGSAPMPSNIVFQGNIAQALTDLNLMPDAVLDIMAFAALDNNMAAAPPTSFKGPTDVALIIQGLAQKMGYGFENNGVSVQLSDPYFANTLRQQALNCADHANINIYFDDTKNVVAIWPKLGSRAGEPPLISKETGMVSTPSWSDAFIHVRTFYNPALQFGSSFRIESQIKAASKTWQLSGLTHSLESDMPGGAWFSDIVGSVLGQNVDSQ